MVKGSISIATWSEATTRKQCTQQGPSAIPRKACQTALSFTHRQALWFLSTWFRLIKVDVLRPSHGRPVGHVYLRRRHEQSIGKGRRRATPARVRRCFSCEARPGRSHRAGTTGTPESPATGPAVRKALRQTVPRFARRQQAHAQQFDKLPLHNRRLKQCPRRTDHTGRYQQQSQPAVQLQVIRTPFLPVLMH